jgi:hypothetical protein
VGITSHRKVVGIGECIGVSGNNFLMLVLFTLVLLFILLNVGPLIFVS